MTLKNVLVHEFNVGDVSEPDLLISDIIYDWQQTELGRWVSDNCQGQLSWTTHVNPDFFGHTVRIRAVLSEEDAIFYKLKYN